MTKTEFVPCIPFNKSWVRGYYEKRNGKLVYIRPYENSKSRKPGDGATDIQNVDTGAMHKKTPKLEVGAQQGVKPMTPAQMQGESMDWLLNVIVACLQTIHQFEDGEVSKLAGAVSTARSIISELGFMEPTMEQYFSTPKVSPTKLSSGAARETSAMAKRLKKTSRRVTKATLRKKVERMSTQLEAAL